MTNRAIILGNESEQFKIGVEININNDIHLFKDEEIAYVNNLPYKIIYKDKSKV